MRLVPKEIQVKIVGIIEFNPIVSQFGVKS